MNTKIDNIGVLIRSERTRRGMTQEELGERVGVGKAQISKIESGRGIGRLGRCGGIEYEIYPHGG